jgi:Stress responsive A/B Barrel Domain
MIVHTVSFRWHEHVSGDQIEKFTMALAALPAQIPALVSYQFGPDLGLREGNADFGVVAMVHGPEDLPAYLDHPAHLAVVEQYTRVMAAARSAVQFALPDTEEAR